MSLANRITRRLGWLRRSSTLRLSLLLSVIFAIGMTVTIFVALEVGEDAIERRVDETLAALAGATALEDAEGDSAAMILRSLDDVQGLPQPFRRAIERDGGTVQLDRDFLRSETWRVLVTEDSIGDPIMIAVPIEEGDRAQELLAGVLWTTAALVIVMTLAIGFGTGLLAQRRLVRINDTLHRLGTGDLGARTGLARSKDDLDDIASELDRTASELERLVAQARHLSGSIAHDLRTPLARLRARLEALPDGEERSAALQEAERMTGIFDTIMRVARIEAAHGSDGFEPVSLDQLVDELAETFGPVVEDSGKRLTLDVDAASTVMADRQMLVQAIANLIQNALVHGGEDITLFARGPALGVADNGAGVPSKQHDEIIKPMVRLDTARSTEGTGLGLALVRAVADRHGATLTLASKNVAQNPKGLQVTLNFAKL
jgi:signal transduction histidine kinase